MSSYAPENVGAGVANVGTGVVPVYTGLGNFGPYVYNHPGAFAVQSGYEGYLVPGPASQAVATVDSDEGTSSPFSALTNFLPNPRTLISTAGRALSVIAGLIGITVMGSNLVTGVCSLTGLCSGVLPFRLGFDNQFKWNVPETLSRLQKATETLDKLNGVVANVESPQIDAEPNKIQE